MHSVLPCLDLLSYHRDRREQVSRSAGRAPLLLQQCLQVDVHEGRVLGLVLDLHIWIEASLFRLVFYFKILLHSPS